MKSQTLATVMIGALLFAVAYAKDCKELGEECSKKEECCQTEKKPADKDNLCTNGAGINDGDNKTCKTHKKSLKQKMKYTKFGKK